MTARKGRTATAGPRRPPRVPKGPAPAVQAPAPAPPVLDCRRDICGHPVELHAAGAGRCAAVGCTCQGVTT